MRTVPQEHLDPQVRLDPPDLLASLVLPVLRVTEVLTAAAEARDPQVLLVLTVCPEPLEQWDSLDSEGRTEFLAKGEPRVRMAHPVHLASQALWEHPEILDLLDPWAEKAMMDVTATTERQETPVSRDPPVHPEREV